MKKGEKKTFYEADNEATFNMPDKIALVYAHTHECKMHKDF